MEKVAHYRDAHLKLDRDVYVLWLSGRYTPVGDGAVVEPHSSFISYSRGAFTKAPQALRI